MDSLIISGGDIQNVEFSKSLFSRFVDFVDVKDTTLKGYATCVRQFIRWMNENGIKQPKREDIKEYKAYLESQNFTAGTKAQYLRAVKHFFKWTDAEGLYPDIAVGIKGAKVRQDNTKKEAFSGSDIVTILNSIERDTEAGKRDYAMILLSVSGGLRIIELQRADIQDLQTVRGENILYIQGKGHDEKDAYTKLPAEVSTAIEDYLHTRQSYKKNDPLFSSTGNRSRGKRLSEPSISRIIKTRFISAGYDCSKLTAHSLRHTSNTLLFKSGADLYTVQRHARHSDPKTTEIYLHVMDRETDKSEQQICNQIFRPGEENFTRQVCDIMQKLPVDLQKNVLEYVKEIEKGVK